MVYWTINASPQSIPLCCSQYVISETRALNSVFHKCMVHTFRRVEWSELSETASVGHIPHDRKLKLDLFSYVVKNSV